MPYIRLYKKKVVGDHPCPTLKNGLTHFFFVLFVFVTKNAGGQSKVQKGADDALASEKGDLLAKRALFSTITVWGGGGC